MTPARQLPERPDLGQLKRQAKDLLRSARAADPTALARFRILPSLARASDADLSRGALALHDAQSVIAREHGFASWKALLERVEELTLEFGEAVDRFVEAATDGRSDRAERLLALSPRIAGANLYTELVLGDAAGVESRLAEDPSLAHRRGGVRGWEPLHYVCHTSLARIEASDPRGYVAIARRLLELGADPDTRFPWPHHGVHRPVLWGAASVSGLLPLVELLLEAGASPDDGVTLPLAAGAGDLPVLELLLAHGADVDQPWATDGSSSLYACLGWAGTPAGARWLLEHGAAANAVFAENGETPLHVVARRWDVAMAELLVAHGADPSRPRADGRTPYAVAELNGNREVADWLRTHGAAADLSDVDRLVSACSRGDRPTAHALLAADPGLRGRIRPEHHVAMYQAAARGDITALETMLDCGFDVDQGDDEIGKTALHSAAMAGRPESVRTLLARGASVTVRDREFQAQPLVWAAESARSKGADDEDYREVARLLLEAGSPLAWEAPTDEPAEGIVDILAEWRRTLGGEHA